MTSLSPSASESRYPNLSLMHRDKIRQTSVDCMKLIGKLDKSIDKLSRLLDKKLAGIQNVTDLTTCSDEIEKIQVLKRSIEILTSKKLDLAIKSYDFIDLNVKGIDTEMNVLEKAIVDAGQAVPIYKAGKSSCLKESDDVLSEAVHDKRELGTTSNEPVYCICKQVAFGDMIACDNEDCAVEWFHYACVNLSRKPKNSWICPLCSNKKRKMNF